MEQEKKNILVLGEGSYNVHPVAGQGFNLILRDILYLNSKINEHTTSFRGFNLDKLNKKKFNFNLIKSKGYSFFMETIYHLRKCNCSIKEIPIVFKDRENGVSKIPKFELFRTLSNLFYLKIYDIFN